jgi:hypothetical protein
VAHRFGSDRSRADIAGPAAVSGRSRMTRVRHAGRFVATVSG